MTVIEKTICTVLNDNTTPRSERVNSKRWQKAPTPFLIELLLILFSLKAVAMIADWKDCEWSIENLWCEDASYCEFASVMQSDYVRYVEVKKGSVLE